MAGSDRNSLFHAVLDGDKQAVETYMRAVSVDAADPLYGFTAVHVACAKNRSEIVSLLMDRGASMTKGTAKDVPDKMSIFEWRGCAGSTPLHVAVQTRSVDAVKLILASAAKAADSHTATALLAAKDSRGKTARSYADKETADIFDFWERRRAASAPPAADSASPRAQESKQQAQEPAVAPAASVASVPAVVTAGVTAAERLKLLEIVTLQMNHFLDKAVWLPGAGDASDAKGKQSSGLGGVILREFDELKQYRNAILSGFGLGVCEGKQS